MLKCLERCIAKGLERTASPREALVPYLDMLRRINECLEPEPKSLLRPVRRFNALLAQCRRQDEDPIFEHMAKVMESFRPGLFVGAGLPTDNLDLERFFKKPKGHERRIHGRAHAGIRLVREGATLVPVVDAHTRRIGPYTAAELRNYLHSPIPECQRQAEQRHTIMRAARSKTKRPVLLAELESRYLAN